MMMKIRSAPGALMRYAFYCFAATLAFVLAFLTVGTASKYLLSGESNQLGGVVHADAAGDVGSSGTACSGTASAGTSGSTSGTGVGGTDGGCSSGATAGGTAGSTGGTGGSD